MGIKENYKDIQGPCEQTGCWAMFMIECDDAGKYSVCRCKTRRPSCDDTKEDCLMRRTMGE